MLELASAADELELPAAAAAHSAAEKAMGVFESPQFVDMVLKTDDTSSLSFVPKHVAAESRKPPPLPQTQALNFATVE